jgi:hypothetical protein
MRHNEAKSHLRTQNVKRPDMQADSASSTVLIVVQTDEVFAAK